MITRTVTLEQKKATKMINGMRTVKRRKVRESGQAWLDEGTSLDAEFDPETVTKEDAKRRHQGPRWSA